MQWKDIFYFTRKERRGILSLLAIILLLCILLGTLPFYYKTDSKRGELTLFQEEYEALIKHRAQVQDSLQQAKHKLQELHPFNPNTASESELLKAGLSPNIAKNIINYRSKGGQFRTKAALKKLYTISDSIFANIAPFIELPTTYETNSKQATNLYEPLSRPTYRKTEKYTTITTLAINQTDTTSLKKIPGIGSYLAHKIIRYRNQLGGYYSIEQLEEIGLDAKQLAPWFKINVDAINKLELNHAEFKELLKHPYLSYEQVKAIFSYKRKHGSIKNIKQLQFLEEFNEADLERLKVYLSFN